MAILLTNEDLKTLITPQIAMEVMEQTYKGLAEERRSTKIPHSLYHFK